MDTNGYLAPVTATITGHQQRDVLLERKPYATLQQ